MVSAKIWGLFRGTAWRNRIDLNNFILENYTPYDGDGSFLAAPTPRTEKMLGIIEDLLRREQENGGVLDIDTNRVSSLLTYRPGYLDKDNELIVGLQTEKPLCRAVNPFGGFRMSEQACEQYGYKIGEDVRKEFTYRTTHNSGVFRVYTDEMKAARHAGLLTGLPDAYSRGRIIGDYRRVALYGVNTLIEEKLKDKRKLQSKTMTESNIRLIEDIAKQTEFLSALVNMAAEYGVDIGHPAETAREAIQSLYFGYLGAVKEQNGAANSIGRITTFLDVYIERDLAAGILDESGAQELIDDLVLKLRLVRHLRTNDYNELFAGDPVWVTMSEAGMAKDGRHMVTKSAFRVLHTLYNLGASAEPNITILWSERLPAAYKAYCAQVSIDTDSVQYENDDLMRPVFGDDYAIACCVSAMKVGKQMQFFGARCNLPKVLLMSLNGGKDELHGAQIGPKGKTFDSGPLDYPTVLAAYRRYSTWMAALYVNTMNVIHYMHDKYAYERLMMSLHDTDPERLMAFGVSGFSVLVDSLSAIKYAQVKAIKDERGIITNFETTGDYPKFGNNDDRVDKIAADVLEWFYADLKRVKPYRDAKHTLSVLTITSNVMYGKKTGATPDGREAGKPFAPGANPMHGRDAGGALASLASVAKLPYSCCLDGISNTFSVIPDALGDGEKERIQKLTALLDGYFAQNAHHLNVNVLNREKLIDAMNHPDKYPNLTIRVSGYAVNFNKLSRQHQEEVIARTFHGSL